MNIIIPICGKGERFRSAGYTTPKPLVKVLDKPILFHLLTTLNTQSDDRIYIVYSQAITPLVKEDMPQGKTIDLVAVDVPTKGAADTVRRALSLDANIQSDCPALVMDGDAFYTIDILEVLRDIRNGHNAVLSFTDTSPSREAKYSYVTLDKDASTVLEIAEKRRISDIANTGAYFFSSTQTLKEYCDTICDNDITTLGETYMSCVVNEMLSDGHNFVCHLLANHQFVCLGTPQLVNDFVNRSYAFLFDLDGTIVHTNNAYLNAWNDILSPYNMVLDEHLFNKYICGKSDASVVTTLLPSAKVSEISELKDKYFLEHLKDIRVTRGFLPFLRAIKEQGHRVAIVTNSNRKAAEHVISHIGISGLVDVIVIGSECPHPKPFKDPYAKALSHFHLPSSRAIVFEDSNIGIQSAISVCPLCVVGVCPPASSRQFVDIEVSSFETLDVQHLIAFKSPYVRDEMRKCIEQSLMRKYDVSSITINDVKMKGGFIADVFDVVIALKDTEATPMYCVAKMKSSVDSLMNKVAESLDLHGREFYFYENIANYINIRCPRCISLIKNTSSETCGVLLQNLYQDGCVVASDMNTVSVDVPLKIINQLAQLHASFWNKDLTALFPQLRKINDPLFRPQWGEFIKDNWEPFKQRWGHILNTKQIQMGEHIVSSFDDIQMHLSTGDLTFCHGDVKAPNIFFDPHGEPIFLDWQYITCGKGVQDLMFFIIESFDVDHVRRYLNLFKDYYFTKLQECGVNSYDKECFLKDCDVAVCCFPFFVAVWFGTMPVEQLLDVTFPGVFIQKLFHFYEHHVNNMNHI